MVLLWVRASSTSTDGQVYVVGPAAQAISRADQLITRQRLRNYSLIFLVLGSGALLVSSIQRILAPEVVGSFLPDYLAHWTGGVLLLSGDASELYDPAAQARVQQDAVGATGFLAYFVSPPVVAALYAPLALVPYPLSAASWLVLNLMLLWWCLHNLEHIAPAFVRENRLLVVLGILASAPILELVGGGQDSAFMLAIWLGGIRLLNTRHQFLAGVVFGLGLTKPQHVIFVPLMFLATRRYMALAGFCCTAVAQLGLSLALVGPEGLGQWVAAIFNPLFEEQVQQGQAWKMVSVPALAVAAFPGWDWLGGHLTLLSVGAGAISLVVLRWNTRKSAGDVTSLWAWVLAATVVFSPHLVIYDAVLMLPLVLVLLERRNIPAVRLTLVAAFALLWLAPALHLASTFLQWPFLDLPWSAVTFFSLWAQGARALSRKTAYPTVS